MVFRLEHVHPLPPPGFTSVISIGRSALQPGRQRPPAQQRAQQPRHSVRRVVIRGSGGRLGSPTNDPDQPDTTT